MADHVADPSGRSLSVGLRLDEGSIAAQRSLHVGRLLTVDRVREISAPADYFALFLLLAIVMTGNAMRFLGHFDLAQSRQYFASLMMLQWPVAVPENGWFLAHLFLGQMLLLYMPFSKIMHFGGVFFTQAAIKRS